MTTMLDPRDESEPRRRAVRERGPLGPAPVMARRADTGPPPPLPSASARTAVERLTAASRTRSAAVYCALARAATRRRTKPGGTSILAGMGGKDTPAKAASNMTGHVASAASVEASGRAAMDRDHSQRRIP